MKYIRVASDLHLEGYTGKTPDWHSEVFLPAHENDASSVLVLAGDISSSPEQLLAFIRYVEPRFEKVFYVPGNHEYYKQNYQGLNAYLTAELQGTNVLFSGSETFCHEHDGVRFVGCTLWGDGGPDAVSQVQVQHFLNDFRLIKFSDEGSTDARSFKVQDMIGEFKRQKAQIKQYLNSPFNGDTVLITHHLPSRRLVSKRFWTGDGSDGANGGFVGACDDILAYDIAPKIWIHGHTHDTGDTMLWKTRIVCHPAGYRSEYGAKFNEYMKPFRDETGFSSLVAEPKFIEV